MFYHAFNKVIYLHENFLHSSINFLIVVKSPGCLFSRCARCQQTFTEENQKSLCFSCLYKLFLYAEMLSQPAPEQQKQTEMQSVSSFEEGSTGIESKREKTSPDNT